ncbi:MAG: M28 family metallopeptidase [Candidatus Saccharibacteria bacterium]
MRGVGKAILAILIAVALIAVAVIVIDPSSLGFKEPNSSNADSGFDLSKLSRDPIISEMMGQMDEREIGSTVNDLQNFTTRHYGYAGNQAAAVYLFNRLNNISGLSVEYQGGELRNVVATFPGQNTTSPLVIVGAHYDSTNDKDQAHAPGATDDGGGVAIVLELARIMSQHTYNQTLKFALWNAEEQGDPTGSTVYVRDLSANRTNVSSYINFDSACYDPENRFILDIMYNEQSQWVAEMMAQHNALYGIGFNLTTNTHNCGSDHVPFWNHGYTAVMTHSETHGPAHKSTDTVDKISTAYAKKNGQLGLSVLATIAGVRA